MSIVRMLVITRKKTALRLKCRSLWIVVWDRRKLTRRLLMVIKRTWVSKGSPTWTQAFKMAVIKSCKYSMNQIQRCLLWAREEAVWRSHEFRKLTRLWKRIQASQRALRIWSRRRSRSRWSRWKLVRIRSSNNRRPRSIPSWQRCANNRQSVRKNWSRSSLKRRKRLKNCEKVKLIKVRWLVPLNKCSRMREPLRMLTWKSSSRLSSSRRKKQLNALPDWHLRIEQSLKSRRQRQRILMMLLKQKYSLRRPSIILLPKSSSKSPNLSQKFKPPNSNNL